MSKCKECEAEFVPRTFVHFPVQEFCCEDCKQVWFRRYYREQAVKGGTVETTPEQSAVIQKLIEGFKPWSKQRRAS
jgi:hypothetical protein